MYASVRRYEGVMDPRETERVVREKYLPIVSEIPGFVAFSWVDAGGGVVVSTSIFQNQAGAEESDRRAAAVIRAELSSVLPKSPQITTGEVVVHKTS
jgi:hypothetical protein